MIIKNMWDVILGKWLDRKLKVEFLHKQPFPETLPWCLEPVINSEGKMVNEQVENLLKFEIIEESLSPFASPVVLVKKKGGSDFRLTIDYRDLNAVTRPTALHPLPLTEDCLSRMHGNRYFSALDCMSAYYQVPLSERAKERSAFVTAEGNYQFRVLPFGLTYVPSIWSLLARKIFHKIKDKSIFVYLDDIILFSDSIEAYIQTLK